MESLGAVWSDGEFLDVPDDRDGMFAFETDSLLSGQSHGSGTSPGRSLQGSIPTFRKWVKATAAICMITHNEELQYWGTHGLVVPRSTAAKKSFCIKKGFPINLVI